MKPSDQWKVNLKHKFKNFWQFFFLEPERLQSELDDLDDTDDDDDDDEDEEEKGAPQPVAPATADAKRPGKSAKNRPSGPAANRRIYGSMTGS